MDQNYEWVVNDNPWQRGFFLTTNDEIYKRDIPDVCCNQNGRGGFFNYQQQNFQDHS